MGATYDSPVIFRTAATTAALAIVLAIVGAVTGPQWDPVPVTEHLEPTTPDTTIGASLPAAPTPSARTTCARRT